MAENRTEIFVGGLVLALAVGFGATMLRVSGLGSGGSSYPLSASFQSVEGISSGTDVRMAGVKVGTVTGIALDPATFRASTSFTVAQGIEIPDDSQAVISSEGLLGGNFVEILPGGSPLNFAPGDQILDTQGSVSLISLLLRFVAGGGSE